MWNDALYRHSMSAGRSQCSELRHFREKPTACREIDLDEVSSPAYCPIQREKQEEIPVGDGVFTLLTFAFELFLL